MPRSERDGLFEIHQTWIGYVQPEGIIVAPHVLSDRQVAPETLASILRDRQEELKLHLDPKTLALKDVPAFLTGFLGWRPSDIVGGPGGESLPSDLVAELPEWRETLRPDYAVRSLTNASPASPWQVLIVVAPAEIDIDSVPAGEEGWPASEEQRFERLLRGTKAFAGLLIGWARDSSKRLRPIIRLVYAPAGETSGYADFDLKAMTEMGGRLILAALEMLIGEQRLFNSPEETLLALLVASRKAQAEVSTKLSQQVLTALYALLAGYHEAEPQLIGRLAHDDPDALYGGLLTFLMRLVFILYAEDRSLMLSGAADDRARGEELYIPHYSLRGLFGQLVDDAARYPDTMDERFGAFGRLLVLFRLVYSGASHGPFQLVGRKGQLFDPERFPFLEGRACGEAHADLPRMSDGVVKTILDSLMSLDGDRLSYRNLDVEQIGSVYQSVMGFEVTTFAGRAGAVRSQKAGAPPVFLDFDALARLSGDARLKHISRETSRKHTGAVANAIKAARSADELWQALLREQDHRASPQLLHPGTPLLQPTDERRRTGSHYTPRELTKPIVGHALEPIFLRLGIEATPEQVLALKVLDPAMGSGAFLVEACRELGEHLVQAWKRHNRTPTNIPPDEDDLLYAKRLVARRCLYGVDRNPLATDLAKLSLWLATLARDHEFTFLDHALKSGDALVGLTQNEIAAVDWDPSKKGLPLFLEFVAKRVEKAMIARGEIRSASDDTSRAILEGKHRAIEDVVADVRVLGDAVLSAFFGGDKPRARETCRQTIESWVAAAPVKWEELRVAAADLRTGLHPVLPFHWPVEFPEVFGGENPGFDAIVGNPPYGGKNTIIGWNRKNYLPWLQTLQEGAHGNADLAAHFFRRAFGLLREGGAFGLISTNTIAQGDTRATGLEVLLANGGVIYRANKRFKWPGQAAVVVSVVHMSKGATALELVLDERPVTRISAYLVEGDLDTSPQRLVANERKSFQGSIVLGMGFTFDDFAAAKGEAENLAKMRALIEQEARNAERIFPYIGGDEVNNSPTNAHHRFVIDFADYPLKRDPELPHWQSAATEEKAFWLSEGVVPEDYPLPVADDWPELLSIVRQRVLPGRNLDKRAAYRNRWWRFAERRNGLYATIAPLDRVLAVNCGATPHLAAAELPARTVFANTLAIFALPTKAHFALLQSRVHEVWARFLASSMKDDLRYTPTDCFETFPFPPNVEANAALQEAGRAYHDFRAQLMIDTSKGLTKTYNRFHDPNVRDQRIVRLHQLHDAIDRAVLDAYDWNDLQPQPLFLHAPPEEGEPPVLPTGHAYELEHAYQKRYFWPAQMREAVFDRLIRLNAERAEDERRRGLTAASEADEEVDELTENADDLLEETEE
jgi:N-6 DNA Methylase